jgi:16S rRNA (guanine527-N7)-methyltransferase
LPFVKIGGKMIAYKSVETNAEVAEAKPAIKLLGGEKTQVVDVSFEDASRTLVVIDKSNKTPSKYPRGGNKPRLQPLI